MGAVIVLEKDLAKSGVAPVHDQQGADASHIHDVKVAGESSVLTWAVSVTSCV